jgi:hypothetical protein
VVIHHGYGAENQKSWLAPQANYFRLLDASNVKVVL